MDGMVDVYGKTKFLVISFQAFNVVFQKAIERAEPSQEIKIRVDNLIDCITYSVFIYTTRGLFEADKLTFTAQVAFQVFLGSCTAITL